MLAVDPLFFKDVQHQAFGLDGGAVIGLGNAIDDDIAIIDKGTTIFTGAKTLRLQDAV
ncbi:hypothetical protein D3C72_1392390 [compost metagenome]